MKKVIVLLIYSLFLASCGSIKKTPVSKRSEFLLGTLVSVTVYDYGTAEETVLGECFSIISEYEQIFSYNDENSELYKLNSSAFYGPVKVSDDLFEIIVSSLAYCEKTSGAFDIGLGRLIEIWDSAAVDGTPPESDIVEKFIGFKGYEHIVVDYDDLTVSFNDERTAIHLGACAKGFVEDKITAFLKESGVESALLDFGGSISAVGNKDGKPFSIGITDPLSVSGLAGTIDISDKSVVTSGNYRRYFEYNGVIYHHILDSQTAFPSDSDINSVSIVCESAFLGDCYSTASFVLGGEKAAELLNSENLGYIIITDESVEANGVELK